MNAINLPEIIEAVESGKSIRVIYNNLESPFRGESGKLTAIESDGFKVSGDSSFYYFDEELLISIDGENSRVFGEFSGHQPEKIIRAKRVKKVA